MHSSNDCIVSTAIEHPAINVSSKVCQTSKLQLVICDFLELDEKK